MSLQINQCDYESVQITANFLKGRNPLEVLKKIYEKFPDEVKESSTDKITHIIEKFNYTPPECYGVAWENFMLRLEEITKLIPEDVESRLMKREQWVQEVWTIYADRKL
jgi:hypothetical protein